MHFYFFYYLLIILCFIITYFKFHTFVFVFLLISSCIYFNFGFVYVCVWGVEGDSVSLYLQLPLWGSIHQVPRFSCISIDNVKSQYFIMSVIQHHSPATHTSPETLPWILTPTLCYQDSCQYTKAQLTAYHYHPNWSTTIHCPPASLFTHTYIIHRIFPRS
jgi:hypothetical protein